MDLTRLARLTAIQNMLQANKLLTATQLADKFDVSIRTIYRDIRSLEQSGVPIITEEGRGYSLMPGYTLPPAMLSDEESQALLTGEKLIEKTKDLSLIENYRNALIKIKGLLPPGSKERMHLLNERMAIIRSSFTNSNYLSTIQISLTNRQLLRINYQTLYKKENTLRFVEPHGLFQTQEKWILIAWCQLREDFRSFRIDQIQSMELTTQKFAGRAFDLEKYLKHQVKWLKM